MQDSARSTLSYVSCLVCSYSVYLMHALSTSSDAVAACVYVCHTRRRAWSQACTNMSCIRHAASLTCQAVYIHPVHSTNIAVFCLCLCPSVCVSMPQLVRGWETGMYRFLVARFAHVADLRGVIRTSIERARSGKQPPDDVDLSQRLAALMVQQPSLRVRVGCVKHEQ